MYKVPMFEEVSELSMTNGIGVHDSARGISYINNLRGLVVEYIKLRTPNDFPEVSPKQEQVGPGR